MAGICGAWSSRLQPASGNYMGIKDRYHIAPISYAVAMEIVIKNHYLHRAPPCSQAYGLFETGIQDPGSLDLFGIDRIVGVITYGTPSSAPLRRGICGEDERFNVAELTRLWIEDSTPKNAESYLIGNTLRLVDKEIIVSYAEIQQGHTGIVYQATNWLYTGLSAKRTDWYIKGGLIVVHGQTLADRYTAGDMRKIYGEDFTLIDRPRKHRYIFLMQTDGAGGFYVENCCMRCSPTHHRLSLHHIYEV